jgi:hypothetical protein
MNNYDASFSYKLVCWGVSLVYGRPSRSIAEEEEEEEAAAEEAAAEEEAEEKAEEEEDKRPFLCTG